MRVPPLVCLCFFPGVMISPRVTGACPVTTDLIMRVNVRTTTIIRAVGDPSSSRFVYPKFRSLRRLKVEVWTYAENQRETDLKRLTASVDEALLTLVFANPKPRTSIISRRSVLT